MWTRPYGNSGKAVSIIGCGGMRFADYKNIDKAAEVVMRAYQRGINYFDMAPGYLEDHSEKIVGAAVRHMTPGTFYTSTKAVSTDGARLRESLERSLKRLGVEKINFFHIWGILTLEEWGRCKSGGGVAAALRARDEGLIEHLVVSSHLPGDEQERMLSEGYFEGITLGYSAINFPYREKAIAQAARRGMGVVTMNPLGGGLIPQHAERFGFLRQAEDETVVQAALRFNVSNPNVTCALVGFSTPEQVDEAVDAVEQFQPYTDTQVEDIRRHILESFDGMCTGCGYCLPCPQGVAIPKLMEAYNLAILAGDGKVPWGKIMGRLGWMWGTSGEEAGRCVQCGRCQTRCTQHLPIEQRLEKTDEAFHKWRKEQEARKAAEARS